MSRDSQAQAYNQTQEEADDTYKLLSEAAQRFEEKRKQESEQIFKSNEFGTGFGESDTAGPYMPKELNARHREIIRLHTLGYRNIEIGNILGCTAQLVSMVINSPLAQDMLAEIHSARTDSVKDVQARLKEMSPLAAEVFLDVMTNGKSETNKIKAATKVLEMTGHKQENHAHVHTHLSKEDILELKKHAHNGPETVDEEAEYTEVEEDDAAS